ncbi:MAG: glycosyltransferase family 39 protein [Candidatus Krumholzibacteria bacterium]|nr:glycosyltransferase family 39 protein [Candidatus Krumholzibacteria bacterium]
MENADSSHSRSSGRDYSLMGILALGALLFRLAFLSAPRVLTGDEGHYAESLFRFLHGNFLEGVSDYWSFLYPFAAIPFGYLAHDAETGLRLLSAVSGAALVIPSFMIARRLWGSRAAAFAGLFIVLQPNLISFSTAAITESLYSLLALFALYLFLRGMDKRGLRAFAAAGAVLGLAYLVRPESIAVLALFVISTLALKGNAGPGASLAARMRSSIVMVVLFAVMLVPYFLLVRAATGSWTAGSKAAVNLSSPLIWQDSPAREEYVYSLNDGGTARRIDDLSRESALKIFWRQKGAIASGYPAKMGAGIGLLPLLLSSPFLLLLVPLGIFGRKWRREDRGAELLLLMFGLLPFVFYPLFRVELRYLVPYLPIYLLWAGAGCGVLLDWFAAQVSARRAASAALAAVVFLSLVPYTVHRYAVTGKSQPLEWKEIGRWIGGKESPVPRILAQSGCSISYYAGNPEATFIPWTDPAGLVRYTRFHRYEYLVVDEEYFRAARPTLRAILDDPPPGLEALGEFKSGTGERILIYRVKPSS